VNFGATNKPGTCLWDGRKLPASYRRINEEWLEAPSHCDGFAPGSIVSGQRARCAEIPVLEGAVAVCAAGHRSPVIHRSKFVGKELRGLGRYADGYFCGLTCGYNFARAVAALGTRLKPREVKS
jgi:hypothetical protein